MRSRPAPGPPRRDCAARPPGRSGPTPAAGQPVWPDAATRFHCAGEVFNHGSGGYALAVTPVSAFQTRSLAKVFQASSSIRRQLKTRESWPQPRWLTLGPATSRRTACRHHGTEYIGHFDRAFQELAAGRQRRRDTVANDLGA